MKPLNLIAGLALCAAALHAQPRVLNTFTATCTLSVSGSAKACTVQQPASGARNVQLVAAYVHSTVAVSLTQERNGTAATTTAVTEASVNPELNVTNTVNGFTDSDVGVGTVIAGSASIKVPADGYVVLDLQDIQMRGAGTTKNYTIRTSAVTGTVTIVITWREY